MFPGFTRVGFYHDFIRQTTGINFDWNPSVKNTANIDQVKVVAANMEEIDVAPELVKIAEDLKY